PSKAEILIGEMSQLLERIADRDVAAADLLEKALGALAVHGSARLGRGVRLRRQAGVETAAAIASQIEAHMMIAQGRQFSLHLLAHLGPRQQRDAVGLDLDARQATVVTHAHLKDAEVADERFGLFDG